MSNVPLPRPGPLGLIQYAGIDMLQYAGEVSAAKDAEIAQLRAELIKSLADNAALRADAIDRQNNVVAPLRARVRVLEDALRGLMVGCKYCNIQGQWHWHEKAIASNEALDAARAALAARTGEA